MSPAAPGRPVVPPAAGWHGRLRDLARAGAAPAIGAAALIGLLSAWVGAGGAGTISRVQVQVTLAAVALNSFTPGADPGRVGTYLTIRSLSGRADELTGATSPAARRVILTRHGRSGPAAPGLVIPARGRLVLSPFGSDVVLAGASPLVIGDHVPLTLTFRHAGTVSVEATVTGPGAP